MEFLSTRPCLFFFFHLYLGFLWNHISKAVGRCYFFLPDPFFQGNALTEPLIMWSIFILINSQKPESQQHLYSSTLENYPANNFIYHFFFYTTFEIFDTVMHYGGKVRIQLLYFLACIKVKPTGNLKSIYLKANTTFLLLRLNLNLCF